MTSQNQKDETFPSQYRLKTQAEFDRVYQRDAFAADDILVLKACRNPGGATRLGLSISRKVGSAVRRNRWKRLIREAFRRVRADLPQGLDIVVRPRKGAQPDYHQITQSLPRLVQRLHRKLG